MPRPNKNSKTLPLDRIAVQYICAEDKCNAANGIHVTWWTFKDALEMYTPICAYCDNNMLRSDPERDENDAVLLDRCNIVLHVSGGVATITGLPDGWTYTLKDTDA